MAAWWQSELAPGRPHRRYGGRFILATESVSFFFSSRRRHTRLQGDWSSDVCSSDLAALRSVGRGESVPRKLICGSGGLITPSGICAKALYTPFAGVDIREGLKRRLGDRKSVV